MNSSKTGSVQRREKSTAKKQSEWDEGPTKAKVHSEWTANDDDSGGANNASEVIGY
jgi:hypothetical protein